MKLKVTASLREINDDLSDQFKEKYISENANNSTDFFDPKVRYTAN